VAARELADENARQARLAQHEAAEQRNLALETLNALVLAVQKQIEELEETQLLTDRWPEVYQVTRRLKQEILDQAVAGPQRVERRAENSAVIDSSMAAARVRMGGLYLLAGHASKARHQFEQAHGLAAALLAADPRDAQVRRELALAHRGLG